MLYTYLRLCYFMVTNLELLFLPNALYFLTYAVIFIFSNNFAFYSILSDHLLFIYHLVMLYFDILCIIICIPLSWNLCVNFNCGSCKELRFLKFYLKFLNGELSPLALPSDIFEFILIFCFVIGTYSAFSIFFPIPHSICGFYHSGFGFWVYHSSFSSALDIMFYILIILIIIPNSLISLLF